MSKLSDALRKKFKTPQAALAALGLDASLLRDLATDSVPSEMAEFLGSNAKGAHQMSKKPIILTRKAAMTMGALVGFMQPRLAADAKIDYFPLLASVTPKNFGAKKAIIVDALTRQTRGKLAKDASVEGLTSLLDALERTDAPEAGTKDALETDPGSGMPMPPPEEESMDEGPDHAVHEQIKAFLAGKLSDEDMAEVERMIGSETADAALGSEAAAEEGEDEDMDEDMDEDDMKKAKDKKGAKDEPLPFKGKPEVSGGMSKDAVNHAIKNAVQMARDSANKVREAERFVRPWVGDLAMAHDSAEEVYHTALTALGKSVEGVHPSAYKAILECVPQPGSQQKQQSSHVALDSAQTTDLYKRVPGLSKLQVM